MGKTEPSSAAERMRLESELFAHLGFYRQSQVAATVPRSQVAQRKITQSSLELFRARRPDFPRSLPTESRAAPAFRQIPCSSSKLSFLKSRSPNLTGERGDERGAQATAQADGADG